MSFFGHKEIKVPLTYDVMMKCKCALCPVQADSACVKPKITARNMMMQNPEKAKQFMSPGMMKNVEMLKDMNIGKIRSMSREQMKNMSDEMMKNMPKEQIAAMAPKADDIPGPYCANGVALCKDLDFNKMCTCGSCQVFRDFNLSKGKPISYFCKDGKPK
ncbi:MAG TPA: hypothetical protein VMT42_00590 [candidate division Zixibacteria bacterium]|nr:hypothetical protein [candidate division Zixibacteria bacterium]